MDERQLQHEEDHGATTGADRPLQETGTYPGEQSEPLETEVSEQPQHAQQAKGARTVKSLLAGLIAVVIVGVGIAMIMKPSPEEAALEQQQKAIV